MRLAAARRSALIFVALALTCAADVARADGFEEAVRSALRLPSSASIIWPPRTGLAAGSVVGPNLRVTAVGSSHADASVMGLPDAAIAVPPERLAPASAFWAWRDYLADLASLKVTLAISSPRLATAAADPAAPISGAAGGTGLIAKAWSTTSSLVLEPGDAMTPERWLNLRKLALRDASARSGSNGKSLVLKLPEGTVLAAELPAAARVDAGDRDGRVREPRRWALATIASGVYSSLPDMNQPWNQVSAEVVADALAPWRPIVTATLSPDRTAGLAHDGVLRFLDGFAASARKAKAQLLVVYYVGHMERTGTGSLSLLMGNAPASRDARPPVTDLLAGNLRDLAQVIDQAKAELAPSPGTLDLAVVHRRLGASRIPFVLLVDGCLDDPKYAAVRDRLGIVVDAHGGEPVYVGPGDAGNALREQLGQLASYPVDFPWLKSRDPTVLGATPGTAAYREDNPVWTLGGGVGPLARRISDAVARTSTSEDRPSLIRLLNYSADRQEIGEQELQGTVSWSDWLPDLRRFDPASFRR